MTEKFKHMEPWAEERAQEAKKKAARVFSGDYDGFEEALWVLRYLISDYYGMPLFDSYFEKRTLEDLVFEAELIQLKKLPPEKRTSNIVNENKDEAKDLFSDMEEEDGFTDLPAPPIDQSALDKIGQDFMTTGNFKEK